MILDKIHSWWKNIGTLQQVGLGFALVLVLFLGTIGGLRLAFANKILPGVTARGVGIGGLTTAQAKQLLDAKVSQYLSNPVEVRYGGKSIQVQTSDYGLTLSNQQVVDEAFATGRENDIFTDLANQTLLMLGLYSQENVQANFDQEKLSAFLMARSNDVATPAQNASYQVSGDSIVVVPNTVGTRLNIGQATIVIAQASSDLRNTITLPVDQIKPDKTAESLQRQLASVSKLTAQPITLTYGGKTWQITRAQLLDWLSAKGTGLPLNTSLLAHSYQIPHELADFSFDQGVISQYLQTVAVEINLAPEDAKLTIAGGRAVVFQQGHDGLSLDTKLSAEAIVKAINDKQTQPVALTVTVLKADVSDSTIDKLGIKELISEGVTYFPGSPSNRLQNVRVGASKYNGVLLKPGQVFSFGEILGEVGPAQGYTPGLIILGDHEEMAYGGGLCQVSSTAYRAALLAGLPILERTNHAFAISYYTAPFGVPGVDATIYYPEVDMKFRNDTGSHILIQTEMVGTTLKFRYYGTKTKAGTIRGPFFVSGSHDETRPSQTVFYRDVTDLAGNVTKTDTINTFYQSSLDFPITN